MEEREVIREFRRRRERCSRLCALGWLATGAGIAVYLLGVTGLFGGRLPVAVAGLLLAAGGLGLVGRSLWLHFRCPKCGSIPLRKGAMIEGGLSPAGCPWCGARLAPRPQVHPEDEV